jgi:hypothetical protein
VKNAVKMRCLAVLVFMGAAGFVAGCKSAPDLNPSDAIKMIQAKYDGDAGSPFNITVNDRGMQQGVAAKYWLGARRYPNGYWGDFQLTPDGKKVIKLPSGGDVIQWRPDGPSDPHYAIIIVPLTPSHLKARSPGDVDTVGDTRTVTYMEDVSLDGLPVPLQGIAQNPGNKLSTQRVATFELNNGAWTLKSIT